MLLKLHPHPLEKKKNLLPTRCSLSSRDTDYLITHVPPRARRRRLRRAVQIIKKMRSDKVQAEDDEASVCLSSPTSPTHVLFFVSSFPHPNRRS